MEVKVTSVADGLPLDPTLPGANPSNGYVLTWNTTTKLWEAQPAGGIGGGPGVTPPFIFSKSGGTGVGSYLFVGNVASNKSGQIIVGSNTIIKMIVSTSGTVASNTIVQLQRRTGVSTWTDIVGAAITINAGNYSDVTTGLNINIGPDYELACYVKSGVTIQDAILILFVIPQ